MSLYGALFAGVSGLTAQSNTLSVISNNIANVNTVGFKGATGAFESLVTSSAGAAFSPGGVIGTTSQSIALQGQLQTSSSPTDIGILGNGFFVVNQTSDGSGQVLYSRAGDFTQDKTGNFQNAAGFYLQAWPLDRNGLLPGAPGNATDTTSSANLSSLETVNVNNLTGSASATTTISVGANLDASANASLGSGVIATLDTSDNANYGSTGLTATGLIVPSAQDSLAVGDSFKVTTAPGNVNATYTYGGFTIGADVTSGIIPAGSTAVTLSNPPYQLVSTSAGTSTYKVSMTNTLNNSDTVTLSYTGSPINGIPASAFNGKFVVSNVTTGIGGSFNITIPTPSPTRAVSFTTSGTTTVVVSDPAGINDLQAGEKVTFSGVSGTIGGISAAVYQNSAGYAISNVNTLAGTYEITLPSSATADTGTGSSLTTLGGTGVSKVTPRLFTGTILNASQPGDTFLGTLATSAFTSSALTFKVTNGTGTATFTYVNGTPNASQGQFNDLTNLASAISASSTGLTARVVNGQLYVGSVNADDTVTFANGSTVGISGPPVQSGIDWVGELGLTPVGPPASGVQRFTSLQGLANLINTNTPGLTATIANATGAASLSINAKSPLDTITFADTAIGTNTGSPLAALGIVTSLGGGTPVTGSLGPLAAAYDASSPLKSMSSGSTTPQFSHPVQVYDSLGTAHNLNIGFIKTGTNTWAAEIYAVPATDVNAVNGGQLASGTIVFNGDGTLNNIGSALTQSIGISWADNASPSSIQISWGTAGAIGTGKTDGLSQFDSPYIVNFANQNGVPVGQLSSVSIDKNGFITASYSNGQTQKLYQIPLAQFTNPDQLTPLSSNVYVQSEASGVVNLAQAGAGGAGTIASSSLEASNVELANELTTMIIAQRSYEANTKVISTADNLLQALNQIIQ